MPNNRSLATLERMVADLFAIDASYVREGEIQMVLRWRYERKRSTALLRDRLKTSGYEFDIEEAAESLTVRVNPARKFFVPRLNVALFVVTVLSCYFMPVYLRNSIIDIPHREILANTLADLKNGAGIEFTIAVISILLVHEMGHYIASRRRDIITSWPFFIPAPNIIGTFGAVIKSKSPFWNRRDLIEVGAAGPIAGWVVAMFWLIYGLSQSYIMPEVGPPLKDLLMGWTMRGESLVIKGLVPLIVGEAPDGYLYRFTEAAFAGWVGLLVTAINMLPIGQLDGGHITYGLWGDLQKKLGWIAVAFLIILGFQSMMWWLFAAMGLIFRVTHPPTLNDDLAPTRASAIMGLIALFILLVSFAPIPFAVPFPS